MLPGAAGSSQSSLRTRSIDRERSVAAWLVKQTLVRYHRRMTSHDAAQFALEIARVAREHKATDVVALDLRGISPVCEFVVICTGTSARQMATVAERAIQHARSLGERPFSHTGIGGDSWVIVDFVNVVLHVFSSAHRDYYDLELLWGDAPHLDVGDSVAK